MESLRKMQVLCDYAQYDLCDYSNDIKQSNTNLPGIYHTTSNNCKIPIFKVLMTNECVFDCKYCINQSKHKFTRLKLEPEEVTNVFLDYYQKKYVYGLFLSSGIIKSANYTMENMIEVAKILRKDYGYNSYIHLKIVPGASKESIKRAMRLANRVSINFESATPDGLSEISPTKSFKKDILRRFKWIDSIKRKDKSLAQSGATTQFVIGANDETDHEVLSSLKSFYKRLNIHRSYFSAFDPVSGTELESKEKCSSKRTAQLYHAEALIKTYRFDVDEIVFNKNGLLSEDEDPKYLSALNMNIFPVEINSAPLHELLRVPGIGPKSASKIINIRKKMPFKTINELKKLGVVVSRAEPFIKLKGSFQTSLTNF
ncbi:MAG: helix-hairpin-helix domain-containing protein [Methanobrevibacter sp.]|jgi:predicted DNA-binding helix-hairpin-helix protein|nr:helix-hairpin-helix domain-containing protein [Candidatus Methanovirga basalitermitum]